MRIPIVPIAIGVGALWLLLTTPAAPTRELPQDRERGLEQQRLQARAEGVLSQVRANPQSVSSADLGSLVERVRAVGGLEAIARQIEEELRARSASLVSRARSTPVGSPTTSGLLQEMTALLEPLERADMRIEEVELSAAIDDLRSTYVADLRRRGNQLLIDFGRGVTTPNAGAEMLQVARDLRFTGDGPTLAASLEERARIVEERLREMGPAFQASFSRGI